MRTTQATALIDTATSLGVALSVEDGELIADAPEDDREVDAFLAVLGQHRAAVVSVLAAPHPPVSTWPPERKEAARAYWRTLIAEPPVMREAIAALLAWWDWQADIPATTTSRNA